MQGCNVGNGAYPNCLNGFGSNCNAGVNSSNGKQNDVCQNPPDTVNNDNPYRKNNGYSAKTCCGGIVASSGTPAPTNPDNNPGVGSDPWSVMPATSAHAEAMR